MGNTKEPEYYKEKEHEIDEQTQLIKLLVNKLPDCSFIGKYGDYVTVPKTQILADIKRLRRELLELAEMIKYT